MEFKQELRELHSVTLCYKSNGFRDEQTNSTYGQVPPLFHRCLLQIEILQSKRVYEAYKMESRKMWKRENYQT